MLAFGLYRGGNRYDLHFDPFSDGLVIERSRRAEALAEILQRFADRLAHYARLAPYNWFNFYDFWNNVPDPAAVNPRAAASARGDDAGAGDLLRRS
jgi:predicted LPLAT superfamily acyltransferase